MFWNITLSNPLLAFHYQRLTTSHQESKKSWQKMPQTTTSPIYWQKVKIKRKLWQQQEKYIRSNLKEQRPREDEIRPHINPPWGIFLASRENVATLDQKLISNILQSIFWEIMFGLQTPVCLILDQKRITFKDKALYATFEEKFRWDP